MDVKELVRGAIYRAGYLIVRRGAYPFGVDYILDITKLSKRWNYPISTCFDVGANDGATSRKFVVSFPNAKILSFEPHPKTFLALEQNMAETQNVTAFQLALGSASGQTDLFEYDDNHIHSLIPDARFAVRFEKKATRLPVSVATIDEFCAKHELKFIDVLKIDTEGFDLNVLMGAEAMLATSAVKFVYVEFNDLGQDPSATGGSLLAIDTFIRKFGYRFIASYNDYITTDGPFFSVSNALFGLPPVR